MIEPKAAWEKTPDPGPDHALTRFVICVIYMLYEDILNHGGAAQFVSGAAGGVSGP
jgi:hypothetical protein